MTLESVTYEARLNRMMGRATEQDPNLDTREGSLLMLANAAAAVELTNMQIQLGWTLDQSFADTADRPYLILRAGERGLAPYAATPAKLELVITPADLDLPLGTRFSIGQLNYKTTQALEETGHYELTCETPGQAGNNYAGQLVIPVEYIQGLASCKIAGLRIPGEEEEDTDAFRQRYLDDLNAQAFGGNRQDYINRVMSIPGVGGVRVERAWNEKAYPPSELNLPEETAATYLAWVDTGATSSPAGMPDWLKRIIPAAGANALTVGGTVRLTIIGADFAPPSPALVETVQNTIDPLQGTGEGLGVAPIGHVVHVEGAQADPLDIAFKVEWAEGYSWDTMLPKLEETIEGYLLELRQDWSKEEDLMVRISQIENRVLDLPGVQDVTWTTIQGQAENYIVPDNKVPTKRSVTEAKTAPISGGEGTLDLWIGGCEGTQYGSPPENYMSDYMSEYFSTNYPKEDDYGLTNEQLITWLNTSEYYTITALSINDGQGGYRIPAGLLPVVKSIDLTQLTINSGSKPQE